MKRCNIFLRFGEGFSLLKKNFKFCSRSINRLQCANGVHDKYTENEEYTNPSSLLMIPARAPAEGVFVLGTSWCH